MAQHVLVVSTCDLEDGEIEGVSTVLFAFGGTAYELVLCETHLGEFHSAVSKYAARARVVEAVATRPSAPVAPEHRVVLKLPPADREGVALMREWARANGYRVSDRGRLRPEVQAAYVAAH